MNADKLPKTSVGMPKIHTQMTVALPVIIEKMTSEVAMMKESAVPMWVVVFDFVAGIVDMASLHRTPLNHGTR